MLQNMIQYQDTVNAARAKYFSDQLSNCHRPKVLFSTMKAAIDPAGITIPDSSTENFLDFFVGKIY